MSRLNPRHSELLTMHYVHGLPVRQMAERLDQSESAVESALKRGREAFRRIYSEVDHG